MELMAVQAFKGHLLFCFGFFLSLTSVRLGRGPQEPWQQRHLDKLLSADNDFMQGQSVKEKQAST